MISGKEVFDSALIGQEDSRPALLLHVGIACASFAGVAPDLYRRDPELVRSSLAELQQVCGADAVTGLYDPVSEDEAFNSVGAGADLIEIENLDLASHSAMALTLDITDRLVRTVGRQAAAVCGVLSGPVSVALRRMGRDVVDTQFEHGFGADVFDSVAAPLTTVLRRLCETGVDAVVLREDFLLDSVENDYAAPCAFAYRMMNAVARHYKIPLIVMFNARRVLPGSVASLDIDRASVPLEIEMTGGSEPFLIHYRVPNEWLTLEDAQSDEHAARLAGLCPTGGVIEMEWAGEGRASLERLMQLGRICGHLDERRG